MRKSYRPMVDDFGDNLGWEEFQDDADIGDNYDNYSGNNRYNNAYGNYRGGYNRGYQGPPPGFRPMGSPGPFGPPGPPSPPFSMQGDMRWRRGYAGSPSHAIRGPRKDKIIKFLIKCGVPRDHVVNLPSDVLSMMEPMNCGICALKFDTSDLARIHYASKNHFKNQTKWVNQRSDPGMLHSKEPLKARELYCELCDVHITSTGHAESHYAGKPHRAIVEGRKNPRNPFLLQPNKQDRLKALIRREVKFLKKQDAKPAVKNKPESKTGSRELYCDICKIAMICSEQMTTHLNGKRHLNKEKQHILKLMKGEISGDGKKIESKDTAKENLDKTEEMDGDEDENEEEAGDVEDDGAGYTRTRSEDGGRKGTTDAEADDDDWGEGGEDWKPSSEDY